MRAYVASKDFLSGLMFLALGLLGLWLTRDLEIGTSDAMATGYFPRMMCGLLAALGIALAAVSLLSAATERPDGWAWRPLIMVSLSAIAFAVLLSPLGFVLSIVATVAVAGLAGGTPRVLPLAVLAAGLAAAAVGLFVLGLGMPIPLWPAIV